MRTLKAVLRVALIVLVAVLVLEVGIKFGPRLARLGTGRAMVPGTLRAGQGAAQPDWGGGRMSVSNRPASGVLDSVRMSSEENKQSEQTYNSPAGGVVLRKKSDSDYAVTMAMRSNRQPDKSAVFDLPSTGRFRKELLPGSGDAQQPASDIPLYPQSECRMQVGRGTACFIGFYLTPDNVEAVRSFYLRSLARLGWQRVAVEQPGPIETFTKRNEDRAVILQLRKQDSTTTRIGLVATTSGSAERSERK